MSTLAYLAEIKLPLHSRISILMEIWFWIFVIAEIHFATSPDNRVSIISLINVSAVSQHAEGTDGKNDAADIRYRANKRSYNSAMHFMEPIKWH